jgi:hypothetical protein
MTASSGERTPISTSWGCPILVTHPAGGTQELGLCDHDELGRPGMLRRELLDLAGDTSIPF